MHPLTLPSFLTIGIMFETHSRYTTTLMNLALWSLSISSLTWSASSSLNRLNFCLTGLASGFNGSWCSTRVDYNLGMSLYLKANTSTNSLKIFIISVHSSGLRFALMSINFGSSSIPRLISSISSSTTLVHSSYLSMRCQSKPGLAYESSSSLVQSTSSYASIPAHSPN